MMYGRELRAGKMKGRSKQGEISGGYMNESMRERSKNVW